MIVDCHTRIWSSPAQLGREADLVVPRMSALGLSAPRSAARLNASIERHRAASQPVDISFVLGFKSRYLDADVPNALIAEYVRQDPERLIGFAGIDPSDLPRALDEMRGARERLGLRGITLAPAAQDLHPADTRAMQVYALAAELRMPVLIHSGTRFAASVKMEYARGHLFDEVAREFPSLKLIVAHLGYPWIDECLVLLAKHPNVFADISGLMPRPWQSYNALVAAFEYGVIDKLLFGSDFPFTSATKCIESLYSINRLALGTGLPTVPRHLLQGIVERDALGLLGLPAPCPPKRTRSGRLLDDHEGEN